MATKQYYAYVIAEVVDFFESELAKRDGIKHVETSWTFSETGEPVCKYIIEAEEGIINPKWELK